MLSIVSFLVTISILVVFHEFGHYICARMCGVRVLTFSLGFGPKLFKFQTKSNEWCISAIPLGGYVRMLDENEGEVPEGQLNQAFNRKKPWQKILIAAFGPLFNILLAFLIYLGIAIVGVSQLKPVIAEYNPQGSPIGWLQIKSETNIIAINSQKVGSWEAADSLFAKASLESNLIIMTTNYKGQLSDNRINLARFRQENLVSKASKTKLYLEDIGLLPVQYLPIVSYVEPGSSAAKSGLKDGDKIIAINNISISSWFQVMQMIRNSPDKTLNFAILRHMTKLNLQVPVARVTSDGQDIGKIGIMPSLNSNLLQKNSYIVQYHFIGSVKYALNQCYNIVFLNLSGLYGMLTGSLSWHNIGGPVTVARAGASAMAIGIKEFIDFLALISVSLAVVNLLPVPVLDGGHIVVYSLEWLIRREIKPNVRLIMFKIGFCLIIGLSMVAIYNDILRL